MERSWLGKSIETRTWSGFGGTALFVKPASQPARLAEETVPTGGPKRAKLESSKSTKGMCAAFSTWRVSARRRQNLTNHPALFGRYLQGVVISGAADASTPPVIRACEHESMSVAALPRIGASRCISDSVHGKCTSMYLIIVRAEVGPLGSKDGHSVCLVLSFIPS